MTVLGRAWRMPQSGGGAQRSAWDSVTREGYGMVAQAGRLARSICTVMM